MDATDGERKRGLWIVVVMGWDGMGWDGIYFAAGMGRNSRQGPETEAET